MKTGFPGQKEVVFFKKGGNQPLVDGNAPCVEGNNEQFFLPIFLQKNLLLC
jgi:hypothetical protein